MKTSLTDLPKEWQKEDAFGIGRYEQGLIKFIEKTSTPMTIAVQGEWGSGKTSLMNTLYNQLCSAESSFHGVWLNSWEFSLMKDPSAALVNVLGELVRLTLERLSVSESKATKILSMVGKVAGKVAKEVAIQAADKAIDKSGTTIANAMKKSGGNSVGELHKSLSEAVNECITKSGKKGVVFFIDDLDRIDPPAAVQLLELLKNIFTIEGCVFVLAIDYDVVVKGLEPKFGKLNESNSREFRSYFDKIIQIPFSMPVNTYEIDNFLSKSLKDLGFLTAEECAEDSDQTFFSQAATYTVGKNPRSLKRLINTLSLMSCIPHDRDEIETVFDKKVSFSVFAIQIAYPALYSVLCKNPNFETWSDQLALEYDLPELDSGELERISSLDEFDEPWELFLYRYCRRDDYLKSNALKISTLLNNLRDIIQEEEEVVEDCMLRVINKASITQVEAKPNPVEEPQYHRSSLLKDFRWKLMEGIRREAPELADGLVTVGKRVQANAQFKFSNKLWDGNFILHCWTAKNQIHLTLKTASWMFSADSRGQAERFLESHALYKKWQELERQFSAVIGRNEIKPHCPCRGYWHKGYFMEFNVRHVAVRAEDLLTEGVIVKTVTYLVEMFRTGVFDDLLQLHKDFNGGEVDAG